MAYHTAQYFLFFLPLVLAAYQIMPKKVRPYVLLIASYIFFFSFSRYLLFVLVATTLWVYLDGRWIVSLKQKHAKALASMQKEEKKQAKVLYKKREKGALTVGVGAILFILVLLKYTGFFVDNLNLVLEKIQLHTWDVNFHFLVPIGISFYSLEAIGYLFDVYWGKYEAEKNLPKLALFLSFFPQTMEGPISMYPQTADALWAGKSLDISNLSNGFRRMVWGLFKKMVIADRLYVIVQNIYDTPTRDYHGVMILVVAVAYTLQLFMEFSGGMDIVVGSGMMFGIDLPENFARPFLSKDAAEFWRRWHISLGTWLKTYVFYPMSVSEPAKKWNKFTRNYGKKHLGKIGVSAICLFPVWMLNGLWHGPQWNYIFYGFYYFVILLFMVIMEPVTDKIAAVFCKNKARKILWSVLNIAKTWVIIFTGELFFRANTLTQGFQMFKALFVDFTWRDFGSNFDGFLLNRGDYLAIIIGVIIVSIVGMMKEIGWIKEDTFLNMKLPLRWAIYYILMLMVLIFGAYGAGYTQVDLIYAGF